MGAGQPADGAPRASPPRGSLPADRGLAEFQAQIEAIYGAKDQARGVASTYMWFAEEAGELARALRRGDPENLKEEVSDVLAWLATLASMADVDLEQAAARYASGCPRCGACPCGCERGPARA